MKKLKLIFLLGVILSFTSCSNSDDSSGDGPVVDCNQLLLNIDSAREAYEADSNSVTCTIFRAALSSYLDSCPVDPELQLEFDNLGDCNEEQN